MAEVDLKELKGAVATICTGPQILPEFAQCREDMRSFHDRNDFHNIEYRFFNAVHVESGRDAAASHALNHEYDFCLQIDADATFAPDSLVRLLNTAYIERPDSDVVSAYCQLKGEPYLPTIDSGTGRWEEWYPNSGIVPVIRTGAHFLLIKTRALKKMGNPPWFRTRETIRAVDALAEIDNICRMNYDGRNPLEGEIWEELMQKARKDAGDGKSSVGEDSGFCDRLKASGGQIYVDTRVVTGHIKRDEIGPEDLKREMSRRKRASRLACGIREE